MRLIEKKFDFETRRSEAFKKFGAFFAFSQKQFDEGKKEGVKYSRTSYGLIIPEENVFELKKALEEVNTEEIKHNLEHVGKDALIDYELANHEAGYTYDPTDAYEAVAHYGITFEEVQARFFIWIKEHELHNS